MSNEIDKSIPDAWRGHIVKFGDTYQGARITKHTLFDSPHFVGQTLKDVGEIWRCSKDEIGLFIAVRAKGATAAGTHWTHVVDEARVVIEYEFDKTTGESHAIVKKYPLQTIAYEVRQDAYPTTTTVVIT